MVVITAGRLQGGNHGVGRRERSEVLAGEVSDALDASHENGRRSGGTSEQSLDALLMDHVDEGSRLHTRFGDGVDVSEQALGDRLTVEAPA